MEKLLKFASFFARRPSDKAIRISRGISGSLFLLAVGIDFGGWKLDPGFDGNIDEIVIASLGLLPIIWGIFDFGIAQRKIVKKLQMASGVFLWILAILIVPVSDLSIPSQNSGVNSGSGTQSYEAYIASQNSIDTKEESGFDPSFLLGLLGILSLLSGLTGKMITQKNLKYKEVITKIRV